MDAKTHQEIISSLVPQRPLPGTTNPKNAPKLTDQTPGVLAKTEPALIIELPKIWDKVLEKNSSKARVLTEKQFNKEFGKNE